MNKPKLFIASSSESIHIVEAINIKLSTTCDVSQWDNAFDPSSFTFPTLVKKANEVNFAIFVFHPDDEIVIRENRYSIVRDNVLFELGLFVGTLGIEKCFIICPDSIDQNTLRIPTDLSGITYCTYDPKRLISEPLDAVSTACGRIRIILNGYIHEQQNSDSPQAPPASLVNERLRDLESQVWGLTHDIKRAEEAKNKLESIVLEQFNSIARPATEREIKEWVEGAKDNYEKPEIQRRSVYYVERDVVLPPLFGANSICLIVGPNAKVFGLHNRGHNEIYFMKNFTKISN